VASSNAVVRSHPWVAYVLGLLLLGSFGYQATVGSGDREASAAAIAEALEFFEANPAVEIDPRFSAMVGPEHIAQVREDDDTRRQENGILGLRGRLRSRTQKSFEALEAAAIASVEELPAWRFAVLGRQSPGLNYLAHAFVNESVAALVVTLVFFLLAGLALETAWGSMLFGVLCVVGCVTGAAAHVAFYGETGAAWIGASGLVAVLMGAYFIRAFRGFTIPGWVVLPAWVALEYGVARSIWIENWQSAPVQVHATCLSVGAVGALVVWMLGIEDRLWHRRRDTPDLVSNPVVDRALQAKQEGKLDDAFTLLEREIKRSPGNCDAVVAFWDVAVGLGQAEAAGPAMLSLIRDLLQRGHPAEAARHWMSLVSSLPDVEVEAAFAVRMGETLLDEGHPADAVWALSKAVDGSGELSSALASRVVRVGRDLDPDLTRRAAEMALGDGDLEPTERAHMQALLDEFAADSAVGQDCSETDQTDSMPPPGESQLAVPVAVREPKSRLELPPDPLQDPHSISAAALEEVPLEEDGAWECDEYQDPYSVSADALEEVQLEEGGAWESDEYQDPHVLSADALDEETSADGGASVVNPDEVEAWNSPGMLEDLSDQLSDDEAGVEIDLDALDREHLGQTDEETKSPFIMPAQWAGEGRPDAESQGEPSSPDRIDPEIDDDTAVDLFDQARGLRVRSAVPLGLQESGLALDAVGSGKTTLPFDRIEALSVAAVGGLSKKAVVVVDAVLNWSSPPDEPLKTIRFRSDEFSPRALAPAAGSAVEALRAVLVEILSRSGATPLPDSEAASGRPFATYPSLDAYQRAVLKVEADS